MHLVHRCLLQPSFFATFLFNCKEAVLAGFKNGSVKEMLCSLVNTVHERCLCASHKDCIAVYVIGTYLPTGNHQAASQKVQL